MSQYRLIFTNIGLSKKQNAELNNDFIHISHFGVGSGVITSLNPSMTGLLIEEYRANINSVDTKNGVTIFDLIVPSEVGGFWIKEIALFDTDGDCICIGTVPITYKVRQDEGASKAVHLKVSTTSTNTENIVFNTDNSLVYATVDYVNTKTNGTINLTGEVETKISYIGNKEVTSKATLNIKDMPTADNIGDNDLVVVDIGATKNNKKTTFLKIWDYISGKLNGAVSTIKNSDLATDRVVISSSTGKITVSTITKTILGYLANVTSDIQTQLDNKLNCITGGSRVSTPNELLKGVGLFLHNDCPTNNENWYIIAINYTTSENGSSMQIAISYSGVPSRMYIRTKHYSKTIWEPWTIIDNSDSASLKHKHDEDYSKLDHNHNNIYLDISGTAVNSSKLGDLHPNYYLGLNQGTNSQDPNTTLFENIVTNHINTPNNSEYWYITTKFYGSISNSSSQMQIAVQYSNGNKVFVRNKYSSNLWGEWREIGKRIKRLSYSGTNIEGQYGFSSVVRISVGNYRCYFTTPMSNTNYSVVVGVSPSDFVVGYNKAISYVDINRIHSSDNIFYDGGFSLAILEDE